MNNITLKNVSKKYVIKKKRPLFIKSLISRKEKEYLTALKNINLTVKKGETLGIIGNNGSGKSTLLKIISGIAFPTSGTVKTKGKLGTLLNLGAGFHPDLTGKENIFVNGALLGMTKKEINRKYDEIANFSGLEDFINQPTHQYSSGMVVRLGFSVAAFMEPDILLLDEVLSVGDINFQKKCLHKIEEFKRKQITIMLVSHDLKIVKKVCPQTIFMKKGQIVERNRTAKIVKKYRNQITNESNNY